MILFQVRDLAAKSCGEPHVAPSWEIAKASLGAMLVKNPELADRAHSIQLEEIGPWDPETGVGPVFTLDDRESVYGDYCLAMFLGACRKEEDQKQDEADRGWSIPEFTKEPRQDMFEEQCRVQNEEDSKTVIHFRDGLKESEVVNDG